MRVNYFDSIAKSFVKQIVVLFMSVSVVLLVFGLSANFVNAKFTETEKQLISQAVNACQKAGGDISRKDYSSGGSQLDICNGFVTAAIGKATDNKLLVELQTQIGIIASAKYQLTSNQYEQAAITSLQISNSLRNSSAAATARNKSGSSGTGTGTGTGSGTGTGTGGGTDTGGGGSTDGGASGGAGLSNDQINSVADVIPGASFDTVLGTFSNPLEFETLPELIIRLINILLMLAAMVSVLVIIAGGFNLVTANGNETKITKGKRSIMWAIGGLVISLMSFSIVAIVQSIIS